jgi:hypothetical protein
MSLHSFSTGRGHGGRRSHQPPVSDTSGLIVQGRQNELPHYDPTTIPLPTPNGAAPYRYPLSNLLSAADVNQIANGTLVFHAVGDTGDYRGQQQDFVAAMMTQDADAGTLQPAFFYHLGDVIYFAGDIDKYGANFYETYQNYPAFIVSIPGNHDCQPDDPSDGPVDPNKVPLDGWVLNFMSPDPTIIGSNMTNSNRTRMDLPFVYWTFTTPRATFIGLFSNVGETEAYFDQNQIAWFKGELAAADPNLPLIVTVHHPPFSGDNDHTGSTVCEQTLFEAFDAQNRYPHLILSGHVHNYQRFTRTVTTAGGEIQLPCIVVGNGGYTKLSKMQKIKGAYPSVPLQINDGLTLETYDHNNFGFLRVEIDDQSIACKYYSDGYVAGSTPNARLNDSFTIDIAGRTVVTNPTPITAQ